MLPPLSAVVGADIDERLVFALDTGGNLHALDLESRMTRRYLEHADLPTIGPNGAVFAVQPDHRIARVSRREVSAIRPRFGETPVQLAGSLAGQVVVISTARDSSWVRVLSDERATDPIALPRGQVAVSAWGDLVAVAAETALVLVDPLDRRPRQSIPLGGGVRHVAFSPSSHRLYVARGRNDLAVVDRFNFVEGAPIRLPGPAASLRIDATGRWLLAQPERGDSVWVIDLAAGQHTATIRSEWREDLPLVTGVGTLLLRQGEDVVALDLNRSPPAESGRVSGGGLDLWLSLRWVPPALQPLAQAAAESALVAQDSALITARAPESDGARQRVYLQISSSRNPDWARELARQITAIGFPASVSPPATAEDGYRVLVGPYPSRDEAEEAGRRLGRPYFVLARPNSRP